MRTTPHPLNRRGLLAACAGSAGLLLTACSPLGLINATVPEGTSRVLADQAYGAHPRQRLDLYLPLELQDSTPSVAFFYGGKWTRGERADYRFVGEALAAAGVACLVIDYRLSPEVRYPAFLEDGAQALAWFRTQGLRPKGAPLYLMGHSAGAYLAAMLALDPRWMQARGMDPLDLAGWIGLAGPYDFLPIVDPEVRTAFHWPDTAADTQALFHARQARERTAPPALLLASLDDDVVDPIRNTGAMAQALGSVGVPFQMQYYNDLGHALMIGALARPLRGQAAVLDRILRFVRPESS